MNLIDTDILIDHFHQHSAATQLINALVDTSQPLALSQYTYPATYTNNGAKRRNCPGSMPAKKM
jgi:hypothetical protein